MDRYPQELDGGVGEVAHGDPLPDLPSRVMGLVNDHQIPPRVRNLLPLRVHSGVLKRTDHIRMHVPGILLRMLVANACDLCGVVKQEVLVELRPELEAPLRDEARGNHDQDTLELSSHSGTELLEDQPGFDRLSQPNLISKDQPRLWLLQSSESNRYLMELGLNPRVGQAESQIIVKGVEKPKTFPPEPAVEWIYGRAGVFSKKLEGIPLRSQEFLRDFFEPMRKPNLAESRVRSTADFCNYARRGGPNVLNANADLRCSHSGFSSISARLKEVQAAALAETSSRASMASATPADGRRGVRTNRSSAIDSMGTGRASPPNSSS
jgi:hypothetical protein